MPRCTGFFLFEHKNRCPVECGHGGDGDNDDKKLGVDVIG